MSPATSSAATPTAFIISSAAAMTFSSRVARTSIRPMSSACWNVIPTWRRRPSFRSTTTSRDKSRSPSWCRSPDADRARTRSGALRLPTPPPTRIRASSGSWTNCRSLRPTRSTGCCCTVSRRSAQLNRVRASEPEREGSVTDRQLPILEEIFLDHVGHLVRDPQSASRALARAGFAPTPVSIQVAPDPDGTPRPTGPGNVTAMFTRGYIEVLFKTADTPLSRELEAARARYPGVHLAAFTAADAAAAHRRLAERGFRVRPLVHMQRPVETGGPPGTAAFTLARVEPGEMPEGCIQILTHPTETMVWQPRWLSHPNGALALTGIMIAVADVEEAARRFARFTDRQATPSPLGQTIELDRGRVQLVTADAFARKLPEVAIPSLPFIGAYAIRVASLAVTGDMLKRAGLRTRRSEQDLVAIFPEELGRGAWLFAE